MAIPKSPFYIVQDFLSPKVCEHIVDSYGFITDPDLDISGNPLRMIKHNNHVEDIIFDRQEPFVPDLEGYYGFKYRGTSEIMLEYYDQGVASQHQCFNSKYIQKKWARVLDRDFTAILFLSDYQENIPFDSDYEVYGGKLEFPQHKFSFNPVRGTMILFPSGPHFINVISPILAGELYIATFHITAAMPYLYQPADFPGNYLSWFGNLMSDTPSS